VTLVVGDPGCGKSLLALDMAARLSRGLPWPDEAEGPEKEGAHEPGSTILLSAEDDLADTVRPRFDAAGGDPGRLAELRWASSRPGDKRAFSLAEDLDVLREAMEATGGVRLVILDPLTAYLGGMARHSNTGVRGVMAALAALAEERAAAVVAVTHMNKNTRLALLYRAMGSLGFAAASRAVWAVLADREEAGRMVFAPLKCNLAERPTALAFRIVASAGPLGAPRLAWEAGPAEFEAEDERWSERLPRDFQWRAAAEWLRALLAQGPLKCKEVQELARGEGFTPKCLRLARERIGVETFREGPEGPWHWQLGRRP
jgi:hypothetical protein